MLTFPVLRCLCSFGNVSDALRDDVLSFVREMRRVCFFVIIAPVVFDKLGYYNHYLLSDLHSSLISVMFQPRCYKFEKDCKKEVEKVDNEEL